MGQDVRLSAYANREGYALVLHEMRTPLTTLIAYADLLLQGGLGPLSREQRVALTRMLEYAYHLQEVVENTLELSRIRSGRLDIEPSTVNLWQLIRELLENLSWWLQAKQVSIHISPETDPTGEFTVSADLQRMRQVLNTLLHHAIRDVSPGGRVAVRLHRSPHGVQLSMTLLRRTLIFRHDTQRPAVAMKQNGKRLKREEEWALALGLVVAQHIIEAHGGRLEVEKRAGTIWRYTIFLPG